MPTALLIVAAMVGVAALAFFGVIGGFVALIGELAVVFVAAWLFDRERRLGARDPYLDANRSDFPTNAGSSIRQVPPEAVQNPGDRGSPS